MTNPTVFISYSHKDEEWKDRLVTHLKCSQSRKVCSTFGMTAALMQGKTWS